MPLLFTNDQHDEFGTWGLAYIPYGGADFGEIAAVAKQVGDGDDTAFYQAWVDLGDRLVGDASTAATAGHADSARELYLRASAYFASAYHPLYGAPTDPRLVAAFDKQTAAFDDGLAIGPHPVSSIRIPYEDTTLPAYLIPAPGHETERRPTIIFTNGYDATITDMYFASAVAALRRGYHCVLFDGPGQGELLYKQGIPMRPDWEAVVTPVVDVVAAQSIVDVDSIVLSGWSLGGFLAPRAASGERRLAAVIADPGTWSVADSVRAFAEGMGAPPDALEHPEEIGQDVIDKMTAVVESNPALHWRIVQRGFWVNGVTDMRGFVETSLQYHLPDDATITCPVLATAAENDLLGAGAASFVERVGSRATLMSFTAAEGAGEHCEMTNRTLLNRRVLDWLDDTLNARG
ncbi:alpha/beta fold hydrolase [Gordonia sp. CPCC 205515]|uniref:alpha/beta hydrolase family protein n=1 Tax=Gordonia sp. CPCC 205515 TaxID=3140791 RepID=UPI003AF3DA9F